MGRGRGQGMRVDPAAGVIPGPGGTGQMPQPVPPRAAAGLVADVDADQCVACGECMSVCPTGAITVDEVARVDPSRCRGDGICVEQCPVSAIRLVERPARKE